MTKTTITSILAVVVSMLHGSLAQQGSGSDAIDHATESKVASISAHLIFDTNHPRKSVLDRELNEWTVRLEREVDTYVATAFNFSDDAGQIERRIRRVLALHKPDAERGAPPFVDLANLSLGHTLIVGFTMIRGVHANLPTLRAYRWSDDAYALIAVEGSHDFDGYDTFERVLRSPLGDEVWVLMWGSSQTANGNIVRARIFAFDQERFRTVWAPPEMPNMVPQVTPTGFSITYEVRLPPYEIQEDYIVSAGGPVKVKGP
jgi:hypothetical protein